MRELTDIPYLDEEEARKHHPDVWFRFKERYGCKEDINGITDRD